MDEGTSEMIIGILTLIVGAVLGGLLSILIGLAVLLLILHVFGGVREEFQNLIGKGEVK
jgi:hypothetical protein